MMPTVGDRPTAVRASRMLPLHEGHGAGQPILNASMSPEQMRALGAILETVEMERDQRSFIGLAGSLLRQAMQN